MNHEVKIDYLAKAIKQELQSYRKEIAEGLQEGISASSQNAVKLLKKKSPFLTKAYKKGWRSKIVYRDRNALREIVHNKTDYQLTHLLEYGHNSKYGFVKPKPHIKEVEEQVIKNLERRVEDIIEK